jgi:hypothetical protein
MSEKGEGEEAPQIDPTAPLTREIDGVTYPVRIVPTRRGQHSRIGVSRKPVRWSAGREISSFDKKGRSDKTPKT